MSDNVGFAVDVFVRGLAIGRITTKFPPAPGDTIIMRRTSERVKQIQSNFTYVAKRVKLHVDSRTWEISDTGVYAHVCNLDCHVLSENV